MSCCAAVDQAARQRHDDAIRDLNLEVQAIEQEIRDARAKIAALKDEATKLDKERVRYIYECGFLCKGRH